MLKTVVVDDEQRALGRLSRLVEQSEHLSLAGSFTDPLEAMTFIAGEEVDVVFLDIEMPEKNGLEMAGQIFEIKPHIDVVFVTAYDQYALTAFQVYASGYLLKPIDPDEVEKQVAAIMRRRQTKRELSPVRRLHVRCLGTFLCYPEGDERQTLLWRTKKAEELFAFLIHHDGQPVGKDKILDTLWPDLQPDKAAQNLHATTWYIRNTLYTIGYSGLFVRKKGNYQVDMDALICDTAQLTALLERISRGHYTIADLQQDLELYQGPYLDGRSYEWAADRRLWLDNIHEQLRYKLAEEYQITGQAEKALNLYQDIIRDNPLADKAYETFISLCLDRGDKPSALQYYNKYRTILNKELGLTPPAGLDRMMEKAMKKHK